MIRIKYFVFEEYSKKYLFQIVSNTEGAPAFTVRPSFGPSSTVMDCIFGAYDAFQKFSLVHGMCTSVQSTTNQTHMLTSTHDTSLSVTLCVSVAWVYACVQITQHRVPSSAATTQTP